MILHVIDSLAPGGAERAVVTLVRVLQQRGARVGVCVTRTDTQLAAHLPAEVPLLVLGRTTRWDFGAIRRFSRWCRAQRVRVIHVHGRTSLRFVATARLLGLRQPKVIFHDHFGRIADDMSVPRSLRAALRLGADHYLCVAPELVVWASEQAGVAPGRITLLPNAVELDEWSIPPMPADAVATAADADAPIVRAACVANYRPQKDHRVLFEAIASDPILQQRLRVRCVGNDLDTAYGREVQQLARRLCPNGEVVCEGIAHDVPAVIGGADFGIVASHSEAGPIVSLEYMAMGRPYVGTKTGEVVLHAWRAGACVVAPPGDARAFAGALRTMVECTPAQRRAMGLAGRRLIEERYSVANSAAVLADLYRSLGGSA